MSFSAHLPSSGSWPIFVVCPFTYNVPFLLDELRVLVAAQRSTLANFMNIAFTCEVDHGADTLDISRGFETL